VQSGKNDRMKHKTAQQRSKSMPSASSPGLPRYTPYLVVSFSELP
jgi:hypothetical protein